MPNIRQKQIPMQISKRKLALFSLASTILSVWIMLLSVGWMLIIMGIFFVPILLVHLIASGVALRHFPILNRPLIQSSALFLFFAFIRPEGGDTGLYTGWSKWLHFIGLRETPYYDWPDWFSIPALLLLLGVFVLDIMILVKARRLSQNPQASEENFV